MRSKSLPEAESSKISPDLRPLFGRELIARVAFFVYGDVLHMRTVRVASSDLVGLSIVCTSNEFK